MNILKESNGKTSSRRMAGLISVIIAVTMALIDQFTSFKVDYSVWVAIYGGGMGLLGLTSFDKKINTRGITPPPGEPPVIDDPDN